MGILEPYSVLLLKRFPTPRLFAPSNLYIWLIQGISSLHLFPYDCAQILRLSHLYTAHDISSRQSAIRPDRSIDRTFCEWFGICSYVYFGRLKEQIKHYFAILCRIFTRLGVPKQRRGANSSAHWAERIAAPLLDAVTVKPQRKSADWNGTTNWEIERIFMIYNITDLLTAQVICWYFLAEGHPIGILTRNGTPRR